MTVQELIKVLTKFAAKLPVVISPNKHPIPCEVDTVFIPEEGIIAEGKVVVLSSTENETN